ncbi:LuxR family transcriptional regulator [Nocardia sp. ET3-3]|uniref:LuxR family transcriptional regulator n=1 Tax=Nocardia terrae TaxID=2675851 RepID=A0A7K1V9N2_9NOCA|nr:helix-turn-helix transcriptional regulator [Nocardia terrae]MVU83355.1 LuxR family transcriptional regulator [Nocardia terrae]
MVGVRRRDLRARMELLAAAGLETHDFLFEAAELLDRAMGVEFLCAASTDPATGLVTASVGTRPIELCDSEFTRYENADPADLNRLAELAVRPNPVGVLALESAGDPARSLRYREFLRPRFDFEHELRCVCRVSEVGWGAFGMYRAGGATGFGEDDATEIAALGPVIASGIRRGLLTGPVSTAPELTGPAVLVVDADDTVSAMTPDASAVLARLRPPSSGVVFGPIADAVAAVRFPGRRAAARVRAVTGEWWVVRAAPLTGAPPGAVAVTFERPGVVDLLSLVVAACGLTARERAVVDLVLRGRSTAEIARALHLSAYTVQDHLKAIFAKTGVRSRRELVARLRPPEPLGVDTN